MSAKEQKTALTDSFLRVGKGDHGGQNTLDAATMDLVEDEGREVSKRRSVLKWDQKKRKYGDTPQELRFSTGDSLPTGDLTTAGTCARCLARVASAPRTGSRTRRKSARATSRATSSRKRPTCVPRADSTPRPPHLVMLTQALAWQVRGMAEVVQAAHPDRGRGRG